MKIKIKQKLYPIDWWLLAAILIASAFGILMVYDSSVAIAIRDFGDQYRFARDQLRWLGFGIFVLVVLSRVNYRTLYKLALPGLLISLILLLAVFIPGLGVRALGAQRWLNFGFFILQPAELAKLALIIYLSAWFSVKEKGRFLAFLILVGMVFGLVVLQPNLGTGAILVLIATIIYFLSGAPVKNFLLLLPVLATGLLVLAIASPYRFARLTSFLNPEKDPLGSSYQIRQVLIALGSGGLTGLGIGKSRQKYEYLPEANTDSIFAIIGEEMGLIGTISTVLIYALILWRGFRIAIRAPDKFGMLLASGITSWIGIQAALNIMAMVVLIPLTGIPLPFVSYGGSSLVILLAGVGILLNVSRART